LLLVGFAMFISYNIKSNKTKMEVFGYIGVSLIATLFVIGIWKDFIKRR